MLWVSKGEIIVDMDIAPQLYCTKAFSPVEGRAVLTKSPET